MEVVYTSASLEPIGMFTDPELDMAYGHDVEGVQAENAFTLTVPYTQVVRNPIIGRVEAGSLIYLAGSDFGGIVDKISTVHNDKETVLEYSGRTWSGVLSTRIIEPDRGKDYCEVNDHANTILDTLIRRVHLEKLFATHPDCSRKQVSYRFPRYVDCWEGLTAMLKKHGLTLSFQWSDSRIMLDAQPVSEYGDSENTWLLGMTMSRNYHPVNHLIGLGKGNLKERLVSHWYADRSGTVSKKQSLHGVDEVSAIYDYSNLEKAELDKETEKKLKELQTPADLTITVNSEDLPRNATIGSVQQNVIRVGDRMTGRDLTTRMIATATVVKKILRVHQQQSSIEYQVGAASTPQGAYTPTFSTQ